MEFDLSESSLHWRPEHRQLILSVAASGLIGYLNGNDESN
jgi:hypothetical protein